MSGHVMNLSDVNSTTDKALYWVRAQQLDLMKQKIVFCWSGGKDLALALNRLRKTDSTSSCICPTSGSRKTKGFLFCDLLPL